MSYIKPSKEYKDRLRLGYIVVQNYPIYIKRGLRKEAVL